MTDITRLLWTRTPASAQEPTPSSESRPDGSGIPRALKSRKQWLCWRYGTRDGKQTKIPIDPTTGINTAAPDAAWSYDECRRAAESHGWGIGISLKAGIVGIDYDHVLDGEGNLKPEHAELMDEIRVLNSYTEVSPSGKGLHVYVECLNIPEGYDSGKHTPRGEIYPSKRFFTFTGRKWDHSPSRDVNPISSGLYKRVYDRMAGNTTATTAVESNTGTKNEGDISDEEVIRLIRMDEKAAGLWSGITTGYPSHSEADAALMCKLAFYTGKDTAQMNRLFLQSGLANREKSYRSDYIARTIDNACDQIPKVYQTRKKKGRNQKTEPQDATTVDPVEPLEDRYTSYIIEKAVRLANNHEKMDDLLKYFGRDHVGDRDQAHLCLLCPTLIRVANATEGTDVVVSGERGAGKTDFVKTISKLIPQVLGGKRTLITGEQSDKWITRARDAGIIGDQCVMIFDDAYKSDAATLWQKQLTTWDIDHTYQALEGEGQKFTPKIYNLPRKTVRIYAKVDDIRDEQEASRILNLHLQNSTERDYTIRAAIRGKWENPRANEQTADDFEVVQCMWEILPPEIKVTIPKSIIISGGEGEARQYQRVYALIASQAAMRGERGQTEITAIREDAEVVVKLLNSYFAGEIGGGAEAMDRCPQTVLNALLSRGKDFEGSIAELERETGLHHTLVYRGIYGRPNKTNGTRSTGLIQLEYVQDAEITDTETIMTGVDRNTRRTKRDRLIKFDYNAAKKRQGFRYEVYTG